jgi:hypothetical protein
VEEHKLYPVIPIRIFKFAMHITKTSNLIVGSFPLRRSFCSIVKDNDIVDGYLNKNNTAKSVSSTDNPIKPDPYVSLTLMIRPPKDLSEVEKPIINIIDSYFEEKNKEYLNRLKTYKHPFLSFSKKNKKKNKTFHTGIRLNVKLSILYPWINPKAIFMTDEEKEHFHDLIRKQLDLIESAREIKASSRYTSSLWYKTLEKIMGALPPFTDKTSRITLLQRKMSVTP